MLSLDEKIIESVLDTATLAGEKIMQVYAQDFSVETKADNSPVTAADLASHEVIVESLSQLTPDVVIVSEEDPKSHKKAAKADEFWIVDPLDGTKNFIQRDGDFTVNIALIQKGQPVFGVIYVPVKNILYWTEDSGAYKSIGFKRQKIQVSNSTTAKHAVASKNHFDVQTQQFLDKFSNVEYIQAGSSIKICLVAEGKAELYPRFGPTHEWDIAAGDAILRAAGGQLLDLDYQPMKYLKPKLLNPGFICTNSQIKLPKIKEV